MDCNFHSQRPLFCGLRDEWNDGKYCDVLVRCKNGEEFRTHRIVLASLSTMIHDALNQDANRENDSFILIPDVDKEDMCKFLRKAYMGGEEEVRINTNIEFLGFTDAVSVPARLISKKSSQESSSAIVEEEEEDVKVFYEDNLNFIAPRTQSWYGDAKVKLQAKESVEERENQILTMRVNDANKPIPRNKRSKPGTSNVWNFFKMTAQRKRAVCIECGKGFKNGPGITSTLSRHLKVVHVEAFAELQKMNQEMDRKITKPEILSENQNEEDEEETEEGKPRRSYLKRSPVWKYFEADEETDKSRCKIEGCGKLLTTTMGTTTNLTRHLEARHPKEFEEVRQLMEEKKVKAEVAASEEEKAVIVSIDAGEKSSVTLKNVSARQKNAIWNYYDKTDEPNQHSCRACFKIQGSKPKNFGNLIRHLKVNHERLYRQFLTDCGYAMEQVDELVNRQPKKRGPKRTNDDDDPSNRTCPECGKVYSKRKGMLVHLDAVHSGKRPYICDTCGMSFSRKESFKRHNHDNIRPFLCSVCGKTFARRHIRDIHERAHYGDKRYPCSYCEKKFVTNQKKTIHERIHTGEKPFECKDCGKKFVQKHQLQTHTRIHTGARPYRCDNCNQMFRHLSTKAKHNCPGKPRDSLNEVVRTRSSLPSATIDSIIV